LGDLGALCGGLGGVVGAADAEQFDGPGESVAETKEEELGESDAFAHALRLHAKDVEVGSDFVGCFQFAVRRGQHMRLVGVGIVYIQGRVPPTRQLRKHRQ
jgi:hypothetical protein